MPLYMVDTKNFCAGVVANDHDIIVEAAPILAKFIGQPVANLRTWVQRIGGTMAKLKSE